MGVLEPRSTQCRKAVVHASIALLAIIFTSSSEAASESKEWHGFQINPLNMSESIHNSFTTLVNQAMKSLQSDPRFQGAFSKNAVEFKAQRAIKDEFSTTLKYAQVYKGIEVIGERALFHYDTEGNLREMTGGALDTTIDTTPKVTLDEATKIVADRFQLEPTLSEPATLKIFRDFNGKTRLVWDIKTDRTMRQVGRKTYVDAHSGLVVLSTPRQHSAHKAQRSVYTADTEEAEKALDEDGFPVAMNIAWYEKLVEDANGQKTKYAGYDASAERAYRNASRVYGYYNKIHGRLSYDDNDSPLVSVVHMGRKMANAFWDGQNKFMAYGDGDGVYHRDLTYALDIVGHEITHGVTDHEANLEYAGEPGALNESYSDFFGKMINYEENEHDWYLGGKSLTYKMKDRKGIRNMMNPKEFGQPDSTSSPLMVEVKMKKECSLLGDCHEVKDCNDLNDWCGVHTNSGIPNRAAALIVESIGKQKAEKLYYNVLTQRLSATSDFHEARVATEKACALMYGAESEDCKKVTQAFDTVRM